MAGQFLGPFGQDDSRLVAMVDDGNKHCGIAQFLVNHQAWVLRVEAVVAIVVGAAIRPALERCAHAEIMRRKWLGCDLVHHALSRFSFSAGMIG